MLQSIRKFASTKYATVLVGIIIIPFVLWGMGGVFSSGSKNTVATINKEKVYADEFVNYIASLNLNTNEEIKKNKNFFENTLSNYIGKKVIQLEIKNLGINITENSLAKIITNENLFKKDNEFSRTKYEKFLLSSNLNAVTFEQNLKRQEEKRYLLEFISGGLESPYFLVNAIYNDENQSKEIEMVNLQNYLDEKKFSKEEINKYFKENEKLFKKNYRSIKYTRINPENLIGQLDYNETFFEKLDEIEDKIAGLNTIENIADDFNLKIESTDLFNIDGKNSNNISIIELESKLLKNIFEIEKKNELILLQGKEDYFLIKLIDINEIVSDPNDKKTLDQIQKILKLNYLIKLLNEINEKKFNSNDFYSYSKEKNLNIKNILLKNIEDFSNLEKNLVKRIYLLSENTITAISDNDLKTIYIVFVKSVKLNDIKKDNPDYIKYYQKANLELSKNIYQKYDMYLNDKYKVDINFQTLDRIKNYFK